MPTTRHLSPRLSTVGPDGHTIDHGLAIATVTTDDAGIVLSCSVSPYDGEQPAVICHSAPLLIAIGHPLPSPL